jgi:beta-fructofuranosidase
MRLMKKRNYADTLAGQLEQLKTDEQMLQFAELRQRLSKDPYRPVYHFVNPDGIMNDPNGLCCWQGRYHLFYQSWPRDCDRVHWGHAVSDDLLHWRDLPVAICPTIEKDCYSGSALVEDDRVIAMYHGTRVGNMVLRCGGSNMVSYSSSSWQFL